MTFQSKRSCVLWKAAYLPECPQVLLENGAQIMLGPWMARGNTRDVYGGPSATAEALVCKLEVQCPSSADSQVKLLRNTCGGRESWRFNEMEFEGLSRFRQIGSIPKAAGLHFGTAKGLWEEEVPVSILMIERLPVPDLTGLVRQLIAEGTEEKLATLSELLADCVMILADATLAGLSPGDARLDNLGARVLARGPSVGYQVVFCDLGGWRRVATKREAKAPFEKFLSSLPTEIGHTRFLEHWGDEVRPSNRCLQLMEEVAFTMRGTERQWGAGDGLAMI